MLVRLNGAELDLVDEGAGVPVVFSHGGSSDLTYWEPQQVAFAERYRFVAYSRRFHGRSTAPDDADDSALAHTHDLVELIRSLAAGPVHLVGFSTAIGIRAARAAPGLLRSLTIIEPNLPWLLESDAGGLATLTEWRAATAAARAAAEGDESVRARLWFELVNNRGSGSFDAQPEPFRRMWLENFGVRRSPASPADRIGCDELHQIPTPTLALGSEHGVRFSRRILDRVAACLPVAELRILPGATHFMSYQAPEAFNEVLFDFFARH
ncbi:MAG TPA: alpha/beta hydrolase [Candidatus Polarisedimenticolia bacterium]|nr:alpha/beta hydrolase [Candidatus Polarisedimenticolia bacterium]